MTASGRFLLLGSILGGVLVTGTLGYTLIEGWRPFDALYMTVITVASVGYGETHPLSPAGRVFTMVLIFLGLGTVAYGLSTITAFLVEGELQDIWGKRRMDARIAKLHDHVIVCGGGNTGRHIAGELRQTHIPFVIVEMDQTHEEAIRRLGDDGLFMIGDATDTEVLRRARADVAQGLVACMPSDKDNLFTVLSARELNPTMRIVARQIEDDARAKLLKAGADYVVSIATIGALRLASEMVRPHAVSVMDAMLREPSAIRVSEIVVGGRAARRTLGALDLSARVGITVFALREGDTHRHQFNPPPDRVLREGDVLIACADPGQLDMARKIVTEG